MTANLSSNLRTLSKVLLAVAACLALNFLIVQAPAESAARGFAISFGLAAVGAVLLLVSRLGAKKQAR